MAYAHLILGLSDEGRKHVDEMLVEVPLEEIADPSARAREERRRLTRKLGIDQAPALAAMGMRQNR